MKAYNRTPPTKTTLNINDSFEGETIEKRVERIMNNSEPITDGAPTIYTQRKDGVDPMHNIRTDRFELALDSTDQITASDLAKRAEFHKSLEEQNTPKTNNPAAPGNPPGSPEPGK